MQKPVHPYDIQKAAAHESGEWTRIHYFIINGPLTAFMYSVQYRKDCDKYYAQEDHWQRMTDPIGWRRGNEQANKAHKEGRAFRKQFAYAAMMMARQGAPE